ncbi:hypothetical protein L1987_85192 [Smallanthus sonchifolius]|uniref:Uncharacterized protein n=1 Tax=Smallanthus sonchifolius TaxID=185202 RepID=A0ACB8XVA7_9ASTR|nr:hypothetical protein L1987_85192 [Smallanthus sonchifolius]
MLFNNLYVLCNMYHCYHLALPPLSDLTRTPSPFQSQSQSQSCIYPLRFDARAIFTCWLSSNFGLLAVALPISDRFRNLNSTQTGLDSQCQIMGE